MDRRRRVAATVVALLALLILLPGSSEAQDPCPNCFDDCSWLLLKSFCAQLPPGFVGWCHCKERPCRVEMPFCTYIVVTP